jgi:hypothetical protein
MPRREILSPAQREELLAIPVDRAGLIEHYVLSEQDLSLIRQRRGDQNRLGIALQLALLRFPGTALLVQFFTFGVLSPISAKSGEIALGRKNWIHVGSKEAGPRVAAIISLVATCRRLKIPVRDYLGSVLPGLGDFPISRIAELTPAAWASQN